MFCDTADDEEYSAAVDFCANGVKFLQNHGDWNTGTMVYIAFAEAPFVNSKGVPCNAR